MIDLHTHTTASDGQSAPEELVRQAAEAGISVLSATDHDTLAATVEVARAARAYGIEPVVGIEITAVHEQRDVHMLGYFLDPESPELARFLEAQRNDRVRRVQEMADRLGTLGCPIDARALVRGSRRHMGRSVGRPQVARALVRAGHVRSTQEAFDRFLAAGKPAFVARRGASPAGVIGLVLRAGGVASLAHPGLLGQDELIPDLVQVGLDAIEVYHGKHPETMRRHYRAIADRHDLAVSGGSDFHGVSVGRENYLGRVTLPETQFRRLEDRARARRTDPTRSSRGGA